MSSNEKTKPDKADTDAFRTKSSAPQSDECLDGSQPKACQPENVRVPSLLAVISWGGVDGQERFLDARTEVLIQYHTSPINTLFIRLQFDIPQPSRRGTKHLYAFIRPQHVRSLAIISEQATPPNTRTFVTKEVAPDENYCLSIALHEPAALVIPKDLDPDIFHLDPIANHDLQPMVTLMDSLRGGLLSQKSFNIRIPRRSVAPGPLLELCKAASTKGLLKTNPRLDDLNSLYGGRGGQIVALDLEATAPNADCPPSYAAAHANPATELSSSNKARPRNKRRRRDSPSTDDSPLLADPDATPATLKLLTDRIDGFIDARIDERIKSYTNDTINARVDDQLVARIDQLIDERVGIRIDAAVEKFLAPIESRLTAIQSSIESSKAEHENLRYDLERDIKELREETEDILSTRFDEEISEAKEDIHDYARGQVEDAKKDIIKRLREQPLKCVVNMEFDSG